MAGVLKINPQKLGNIFTDFRIGFYVVNNNIYFGEMTFYHLGGFFQFNDKKWDDLLGSWLQLPNKK